MVWNKAYTRSFNDKFQKKPDIYPLQIADL